MKTDNQCRARGRFITFEGIDGAGKSTHIEFVARLVMERGKEAVMTREPGGTALGEQLRMLLLHEEMHAETEALLMFAARREHIRQVIEPALDRGAWVISDRFTDASFAYQGGGRELPVKKLERLEEWVHPNLQPDVTFLFDIPLDVASARRLGDARVSDRFEKEQAVFFSRVRAAYLERAALFPERFRVIDSTRSIPEIQGCLQEIILSMAG
ncbi:MAG: dTMP kinase [Alistipes senegalensis]|nr:dTMP kinase [Oxalobacter formigenes]MCM1281141.1 dTMP kinase [Alistipes senegalensis]